MPAEEQAEGSDAGGAEEADSDVDEDGEASPASPSKRRTRRRRRHGKNKVGASSTSTASTTSGGNGSPRSEDDMAGGVGVQSPKHRGVVTWNDLGLGMGLGTAESAASKIAGQPAMAMARCEMSGSAAKHPNGGLGDASERMVTGAVLTQPGAANWFVYPDACPSGPMSSASTYGWQWAGAVAPPLPECLSTAGYGGYPCPPPSGPPCSPAADASTRPVGPAPGVSPSSASGLVPQWLHGSYEPVGHEDLAERLRAVAPEAYED